jgi:DNA-binding beta-propeller fold protein YncE
MNHPAAACLLVSLILAVQVSASEPKSLVLVQTIPLKGAAGLLDHLAIDTKGDRLFVANLSNNSLDVIDLKADKLVKQVPDQQKIHGIAHVPDEERIFVGNGGNGVCNVLDGRTYKQIKAFKFPAANNVRHDARHRQVYVSHAEKALSVIDAKTLEVKATIKLPGPPRAFQIHPTQPRLYVNTLNPNLVVVIDTQKNEIAARFPLTLAEANSSLALSRWPEVL